jgi:biopolymer transport protein ExbD/biopolymer transport protein TolR
MPISRRHKTAAQPLGAINLTPLLDVMCNLLIVFMIVAPSLKRGLQIDLPTVTDAKVFTPRKSFTISIAKPFEPGASARIYIEGRQDTRLDLEQLRTELQQLKDRHPTDLDILIECDREVPCETMLRVLGVTQAVGLESVGVITLPETEKKK